MHRGHGEGRYEFLWGCVVIFEPMKRTPISHLIAAVLLWAVHTTLQAQGCSDAGVCTAGPMGQMVTAADTSSSDAPRHYAKLQVGCALDEQMVFIVQTQADLGMGITKRLMFRLNVPYIVATGNLGNNHGVGDIIPSLSYAFIKQPQRNFTAVVGLRLPTGKSAQQDIVQSTFSPTSHPLPMPYQTGLGSFDLLLGTQYRHRKWTVALAYQHILGQDNQNTFLHMYWQDEPAAQEYFESFALERADDAVVRVQRAFVSGQYMLQPGLLAIYHMGRDSRLERVGELNYFGEYQFVRREIDGSEGLTLNVTFDVRRTLGERWSLEGGLAFPVIAREVRPDGLTRSAIIQVGLRRWF